MRVIPQGDITSGVWRQQGPWGSMGTWPQPEPPARPWRLIRGWANGLWSACTPWRPSTVQDTPPNFTVLLVPSKELGISDPL